MQKITVQQLFVDEFVRYGSFANLLRPKAGKSGEEPVEFFRDMVLLNLGVGVASFSVCRTARRTPVLDLLEYDSRSETGVLPIDGDVVLSVHPATRPGEVPLERMEAFLVPRGTFVTLRAGVWHHAPFALESSHVTTLIVSLERIHEVDCRIYEVPLEDQVIIEMPPLFADLIHLEDRDIQKTLREVTLQDLALALHGASSQETEKVARNLSKRSAIILREEIEIMGTMPTSEVEVARSKVGHVIRLLADAGEITVRRTG